MATCLKGAMLPIPSIALVSGLRETVHQGEVLRELLRQVLYMSTVGCAGLLTSRPLKTRLAS